MTHICLLALLLIGLISVQCDDSKFKIDFSKQNLQNPSVDLQTSATNQNLKGTGVSNALVVIPPCFAAVPHYHPGASESQTPIDGKFDFFILDANKTVTTGTLTQKQIVNYPQGFPHMQFNPYHDTAVILVTLNSENPGNFPLSSFTNFDDTASITGLGQDYQTYFNFKNNVLATNGAPVVRAKGQAYADCLQRAGLPLPSPGTY